MEVHFVMTSMFFCWFVSMSSDFSCKWPWRSKTPCFCHLLWLLILNHAFIYFLIYLSFSTCYSSYFCMVLTVLHSSVSVSVCGCAELKRWRAEKDWTSDKYAIDSCHSLIFFFFLLFLVLLHRSPPLFFTRPVCLSIGLSLFVSLSAPASLLSIPPSPHVSVHFPVLGCSQVASTLETGIKFDFWVLISVIWIKSEFF